MLANTKLALVLATLSLAAVTGCNDHPIKSVEMQHYSEDPEDYGYECITSEFDVVAHPPKVMLVLDKSGSMNTEWVGPDGAKESRWSSLYGVTENMLDISDATMDFGAVLFPRLDATDSSTDFDASCRLDGVDLAVGPQASEGVRGAIPGADATNAGGTPMGAAVELAHGELQNQDADGPRAMVLVTDGLANCVEGTVLSDHDPSVAGKVAAALAEGIPTYVVGIDIEDDDEGHGGTVANPAEELDAIARAGGVPASNDPADRAYYEAGEGEELLAALEEISARLECTVTLPEAATDEAIMRVVVAGRHIPPVDDCRTESGWVFSDADARKTIELCNEACDGLRAWGEIEAGTCVPGE